MTSIQDIWNTPQLDWRDLRERKEVQEQSPSLQEYKTRWSPSVPVKVTPDYTPEKWTPPVQQSWKQHWKPMDTVWKEQPRQSTLASHPPTMAPWRENSWKQESTFRDETPNWRDWKTKDSRLRKTQSASVPKDKKIIPNRFVSRQLKAHIREPERNPIGLFLWGFADHIKVKEIMQTFAEYGDFNNVGISSKNGIRYCFIDFDNPADTQNAFQKIPERVYFGMPTHLQVRYRYDRNDLPSFDQEPVNEIDVRTVHIQNLPHNINKVLKIDLA
jgi:hypothetical protein